MNYFEYKNGELYGEGVSVAQIAQAVGTPVYIYSYKPWRGIFAFLIMLSRVSRMSRVTPVRQIPILLS